MGCIFILLGAFAPRIALLLLWLLTPVVNRAFGFWLWPILGIIFLPFTTLLYVLLVSNPGPITLWGWIIIFCGVLLDLRGYFDTYQNREKLPVGGGEAKEKEES